MDFFINEFSILSPIEGKAFNQRFKNNINLIVGEKDSGKSSLSRAMLYTLGCDVKGFDFIAKMPENIYVIDFNIDDNQFIIIRKKLKNGRGKNFYKVICDNNKVSIFYDTKTFKEYLNEIMNIQLVTTNSNNEETKIYPNHIFLPFYTDQDNSWQNYLVSTFSGVQFINNYKKTILEYFTGARSNEYYELQLKKSNLKTIIMELVAMINSKQLIIDENNKNIKIIESIDVDEFQDQYNYVLEIYKNIIETEHRLKRKLNEKIYRKNSLMEMKEKINSSINGIIDNELDNYCPNCNQRVFNEMEENYRLYSIQQKLIKEREKIVMFLEDVEDEINLSLSEIKNIKKENVELSNKLDADSKTIEIAERANSYALNHLNETLLKELSNLRLKRDEYLEDIKEVEKNLNELNKNDIAKDYKQRMIKAFSNLNIDFSYRNYYVSNLESVNIMLSGATKVQAFLAQYLTIYEMIVNCDTTISIPMFIDTFLKDDFNDEEIDRTSTFVFNSLKDINQSFIFISNNKKTLESISKFRYNEIKLNSISRLLNKEYKSIYNRYSELLVDE